VVLCTCGHRVVGVPKRYPLIELGMGVRFTRQDEVAPLW
jgi:hypothetical protein